MVEKKNSTNKSFHFLENQPEVFHRGSTIPMVRTPNSSGSLELKTVERQIYIYISYIIIIITYNESRTRVFLSKTPDCSRAAGVRMGGGGGGEKNEAYIMTTVVHTVPRYSPGRL